MRRHIHLALLVLVVLALAAPLWAGVGLDLPRRHYVPQFDATPVIAIDPVSGTIWSAWTYRAGAETAVAVAARRPGEPWSEPDFFGLDDGLSQGQPALLVDGDGIVYLAYAVRETGTIEMSALHPGRGHWFEPQVVTEPGERASAPALRLVADRVVLGYRLGGRQGVRLRDWPKLPASSARPEGIQEGPEGFPLPLRKPEPVKEPPFESDPGSTPRESVQRGGEQGSDDF